MTTEMELMLCLFLNSLKFLVVCKQIATVACLFKASFATSSLMYHEMFSFESGASKLVSQFGFTLTSLQRFISRHKTRPVQLAVKLK